MYRIQNQIDFFTKMFRIQNQIDFGFGPTPETQTNQTDLQSAIC